jgi:hypothetical protein
VAGHTHPESVPAPSGEGTVVLDIGGDTGAVVVHTPARLDGAELEIRPVGQAWHGAHTGVRQRVLRDGVCFAAVFGALPAGRHQLRVRGTETDPVLEVAVVGGAIAEAVWPDR